MDLTTFSRRLFPSTTRVACILAWCLVAPAVARAETLVVTNTLDAIPAPEGSLRAAIEASEQNGEADLVVFAFDGGTIELVDSLPDLLQGGLRIGDERPGGLPGSGSAITISGLVHGVGRAIAVYSEANLIGDLNFVDFQGSEVILIGGGLARGNTVSGCTFGRDLNSAGNAGAAVRVRANEGPTGGTPTGTEVSLCRFVRNGAGVAIEGDPSLDPPGPGTVVLGNGFGTSPTGGPGPGNLEAIRARDGGALRIEGNRFSGPGTGIRLEAGNDGTRIANNEIGLLGPDTTSCSGFDDAGVHIEGSAGVLVEQNRISCSEVGVVVGASAVRTELRENLIGGPGPEGHRSHGVVIASAQRTLLRQNTITGNQGFGVRSSSSGSELGPGTLLACNAIWKNAAGALDLQDVITRPPVLTAATPVRVEGDLPDPVFGWAEVFGDDLAQARVFQGASRLQEDVDPPVLHRLPVLGLVAAKVHGTTRISFDREVPPNHTATASAQDAHETTELSEPIPAEALGLVFDVIRGQLENLGFSSSGGIALGPVTCLAAGLTPDPTVSPDVVDPEVPPSGSGFFYLARRRDQLATERGTYDPAICLTDVDQFRGPRIPGAGDCP
jgi:hypothetical protein